eukprot:1196306-Prorocentrum_minimum.AAC.1
MGGTTDGFSVVGSTRLYDVVITLEDGDKILPAEVLESVGKAKEAVAGASGALEGAAAVVRDTSVKAKDLYEKAPKTESGALKIDVPKVDLPKVDLKALTGKKEEEEEEKPAGILNLPKVDLKALTGKKKVVEEKPTGILTMLKGTGSAENKSQSNSQRGTYTPPQRGASSTKKGGSQKGTYTPPKRGLSIQVEAELWAMRAGRERGRPG